YVLKLVDSAGLGVEVTPGSLPGSYAVKLTAPATAEEDYGSVGLTLEGGPFPVTVSIPVSVIPPPLPECYAPRGVEIPAGTTAQIYVECETRGDGGDGRDATPVVEVVEGPKHGKLGKPRRGEGWSYTPDRGFTGTDTIRIKAHNDYGALPVLTISIRVRKPTRYELDAAYVQRVCAEAPPETSCRAGRGRRTLGGAGTGKVSHRNWPAITGVYLSYYDQGGGRIEGAERNDELLGHHGSDTIFGGAGSDVLWGDWDPEDNNGTQRDTLNGGAGSDFIYTSHGRNTVSGGAGNDFIWAFYGHGTIDCGPGNDKVRLSGRRSAYRLRSCERRGTF
ncbi:MAG: hypothetical protein HZB46_10310, partial [Solirubrobacterales bacterium]|nr:hypothetical protein [Solirubrobacterales bacterium]